MFSIFICEDHSRQREKIKKIIQRFVQTEECQMIFTLDTANPHTILAYLDKHPNTKGIYFLDIDLGIKMTGLDLGKEIRKRDSLGKIIILTTHDELAITTFKYGIEAFDFIVKDSWEKIKIEIYRCLELIEQSQYENSSTETFIVKLGEFREILSIKEILYFTIDESNTHLIVVHSLDGTFEFYSSLKSVSQAANSFEKIHKSFVVNIQNIKSIDWKNKYLTMIDGSTCKISRDGLKILKQYGF